MNKRNLEAQSSGNHLKENPEVLSRLGQQAGGRKDFGFGRSTAHSGAGNCEGVVRTVETAMGRPERLMTLRPGR